MDREDGIAGAHRVGRLFRFKISEVDEWVCAGEASEAGDPSSTEKKTDD